MKEEAVKSIVENRFRELGARQIELRPSGLCWTLNEEFFKVTTLKDFWILEWSNNESYASNYCFEDVDPISYNVSEAEIIKHVDEILGKNYN